MSVYFYRVTEYYSIMKMIPTKAYKITMYNRVICVLIMVSLSDGFTSRNNNNNNNNYYYYYYYFVFVTITYRIM